MPNDPTGRYGIRFQVLRSLANREQLMMIDSALKPPMGTLWSPRCEQENEQIPRSWLTNSMKAVAVCYVVTVFFISVFFFSFFFCVYFLIYFFLSIPKTIENKSRWLGPSVFHFDPLLICIHRSGLLPAPSILHTIGIPWAPNCVSIASQCGCASGQFSLWNSESHIEENGGEWRSVAYGANREHGRVGRSSSSPRFTGRCALLFSDVHTMQLQIANPHLFHVVKCNRACNKWI